MSSPNLPSVSAQNKTGGVSAAAINASTRICLRHHSTRVPTELEDVAELDESNLQESDVQSTEQESAVQDSDKDSWDEISEDDNDYSTANIPKTRVWTEIYGLGVGIFCVAFCMQLPSRQSNTVLCTVLWFISLHEFAVSRLNRHRNTPITEPKIDKPKNEDYYKRAETNDLFTYIVMPLVIVLYAAGIFLMWMHVPTPLSITYGSLGAVVPIVGAFTMRYSSRHNSQSSHETLELGAPVAGLISLCVVCTIASSQPTCVLDMFTNQQPPLLLHAQNSTHDPNGWPAIAGWFPNHNVASEVFS